MSQSGPIVIVDDDEEDLELYSHVLKLLNLKNEVLLFNEGAKLLQYMRETNKEVFFILCDINMPQMDGFELRNEINLDASLLTRTIPFLFFSTSGNISHISKAYQSPIQGYFLKPSSIDEMSHMFSCIISYWQLSSHPVNVIHR